MATFTDTPLPETAPSEVPGQDRRAVVTAARESFLKLVGDLVALDDGGFADVDPVGLTNLYVPVEGLAPSDPASL
jgi:hypothetical protein